MKTYSKLSQTVDLMNSTDWKERLIAEYVQAEIRLQKLRNVPVKYHEMIVQINVLESYTTILLQRMFNENIDMPYVDIMDEKRE